ncbi:MAG: hypothetical protein V4721_10270 [Bacteroidota bacterium]
MTTVTKEVRIGSVKLQSGGLSGIVVTYEQTEIRNNREFFTAFSVKKKYPIHHELEETFGWLKGHLLDLCNYSDNPTEREVLLQATEVTGVTYNDKGFIISGKQTTIKNKVFALNTTLICAEDEYVDYNKITAIMDGIYAETKEYMGGNKIMSDEQYVIKFNKNKEDFDIETFKNLPADEQFRIATDIMTKNKCMIVPLGELEEDLDEEPEFVVDTTKKDVVETMTVSDVTTFTSGIDNFGVASRIPETTKDLDLKGLVEAKVIQMIPEKAVLTETENDFILEPVKIPVKVSTAKKAAKNG